MNVRRWRGFCAFSTAIHNVHKQRHGQRYSADDAASLRRNGLNSLQDSNAQPWAMDAMRLDGVNGPARLFAIRSPVPRKSLICLEELRFKLNAGTTKPGTTGMEKMMRPRKTILCVEDNEQVLSVRKFLLETRGYRVLAMSSAAEALEYLQSAAQGSLDLLMADLIMPQMDGNELIRKAKQIHPGLPTLLVSGTVTSFDRAAAADAFLPKGACTPAEVLDRIRILVARKRGPKKQVQSVGVEQAPQIAMAS